MDTLRLLYCVFDQVFPQDRRAVLVSVAFDVTNIRSLISDSWPPGSDRLKKAESDNDLNM